MSLVSKIAPAFFVSALLAVPASAAPMMPNVLSVDSSVIHVRNDGHKHGGGKHHHGGGKHHGGKHHHGGGKHHGRGHGHHHHGNKWNGHRYHHHHGGRWVAGHRYYAAPPGWRSYGGARPWDWQTRGCILVGPMWFCP